MIVHLAAMAVFTTAAIFSIIVLARLEAKAKFIDVLLLMVCVGVALFFAFMEATVIAVKILQVT